MTDTERMRADYEAGISVTRLAELYKVTRADVRDLAARGEWHAPRDGTRVTPSLLTAMRLDYLRGCTCGCIGTKHRVHPAAVHLHAKRGKWQEQRAALPPSTSEILALDPVAFDARITALLQAEQGLADLREKHAAQTAALAQVRDDYLADDARYLRQHREDAETIAELRENAKAAVAVCPDCGEVTCCDEDRCCVSCGRDLIILADRHSADLLAEVLSEVEALRSSKTA